MLFIGTFACIVGLNITAAKSGEQLAIGLLSGLDIVFGLAVAPSSPTTPTPTHPPRRRRPEPPWGLLTAADATRSQSSVTPQA